VTAGQYPAWFGAVAAGVTMLFLGIRTHLLALPELKVRCSACRRLHWRGRECPCTRN
jgi:hypothetical protein